MSKSTTAGAGAGAGAKRQKHHHQTSSEYQLQQQPLLPGLPYHIAQLCLSHVPPSLLYSVCRSWRRLIYSPSFPPFLSIYTLLQSSHPHLSNSITFSSFDLISSDWQPIPQPPNDHPPLSLHLLLRHPSFISRRLPVQSVTVSGNLVILAATRDHFLPALTHPLIFNPLSRTWTHGPPFAIPRRWCAAGSLGGIIYIASGIGSQYNSEVARSVEKWNLENTTGSQIIEIQNKMKKSSYETSWKWEKLEGLRDGKFSREAIDAIGWRGKLCMVNVKGGSAKEGIIYNVKNDVWEAMPEGMLVGWRGPAAAMEEEIIFMVDEYEGILRKYDPEMDKWMGVFEDKVLKGAQYVAAAGGRVCIVCSSGVSILVVDVTVAPPRIRLVETPPETQAIAIHILPRMSINY